MAEQATGGCNDCNGRGFWSLQSFHGTLMIDPSPNIHEQIHKPATEIDWGQQLNETPDTSNSSGQDYTETGKVYKNPLNGKLIIVGG